MFAYTAAFVFCFCSVLWRCCLCHDLLTPVRARLLGFFQFQRSFWEIRGFEEETSMEVLGACSCVDDLLSTSTLLRAGAGYTEYLPADGDRLSM